MGGEIVNFFDNERLDKVDADRLQALVYEYLAHTIGAIMGVKLLDSGGCLSGVEFTWSSPNLTIGECVLMTAIPSGTGGRLATASVLRHVPAAAGQSSVVDLSAYIAGGLETWIWARRIQLDQDMETRREWDELADDEQTFNPNTVKRERIQWGHGGTKPDGNAGWFKVARVTGWSGGSPSVRIVHAFDLHDVGQKNAQDTVDLFSYTTVFNQVYGVRNALNDIVRTIALLQDSAKTESKAWTATPARGLAQLDAGLTAVEAKAAAQEAYLDTYKHRQLMVAKVDWANQTDAELQFEYHAAGGLSDPNAVSGSAKGEAIVTVPGNMFACHVQPKKNEVASALGTKKFVFETEVTQPFDGTNTVVTVRCYNDGAAANESFYFFAYGSLT